MEKQLLFLLDWDLNITEEDLYEHFEPFLTPIRARLRREEEEEVNRLALLELQTQQEKEKEKERERDTHHRLNYQLKKSRSLKHYSPSPMIRSITPCNCADEDCAHCEHGSIPNGSAYCRGLVPTTPPSPPVYSESRSRSSSRGGIPSSLSGYRRRLERSRSRSTHRKSYASLEQYSYPTPPSSGLLPDLAKSCGGSSLSSQENSPALPSPSLISQRHVLPERVVDFISLKGVNPVGLVEKAPKKSKTGILTRLLGDRSDKSVVSRQRATSTH